MREPDRTRWQDVASYAGLMLVLATLVGTGLRGLDFGRHWDEHRLEAAVSRSLRDGVFLPHAYNYPSVSYWLCLAGAVPDLDRFIPLVRGEPFNGDPEQVIHQHRMRSRAIFLIASACGVLWVFFLLLVWRQSPGEAVLAAGVLGLSWEVAYHLRWMAPDGVLMQFGALTLLCCVGCWRGTRPGWSLGIAAAAAAGLACGTKYLGGILLLPVLLTAIAIPTREHPWKTRARRCLSVALVFAAAYLISTPGTLLDAEKFWTDLNYEVTHYAAGHPGHTVTPGFRHAGLTLAYLGREMLSPYPLVALLLTAFAIIGALALLRESRYLFVVCVGLPAIYVAYMSQQRVMIVRNLLLVAPFMAVLTARGAGLLFESVTGRVVRIVLGAVLAGALALNAVWLVQAAESIVSRNPDRFISETRQHIDAHPNTVFLLSQRVADDRVQDPAQSNVTTDPATPASYAVCYLSEIVIPRNFWVPFDPGLISQTFGPLEVNLNYYPGWSGDDRVLIMDAAKARRSRIGPYP